MMSSRKLLSCTHLAVSWVDRFKHICFGSIRYSNTPRALIVKKLHVVSTTRHGSRQNENRILAARSIRGFQEAWFSHRNLSFGHGVSNQYCRSLSKLDHDVSLFYMSTEAKETSVTKHIFGHKLVKISVKGPPRLKSLITAFRIIRTKEFAESEIVHTFNYYNSLVFFLSILARITNKIVIGSSHCYPAVLRTPEKLMLMASLRFMTHVVCLNNEETKRVIEQLRIRPNKVSTIPNGIDVEAHRPSDKKNARLELGLSPVAQYVLCVGALHVQKGQHILLQGFKNVVKSSRTPTWCS